MVNPSGDLVSWKEVAAYLRVSVKTAQLWERERSLPIRRMPGVRSQVRASVADLEAWKSQPAIPAPPAPGRSFSRIWLALEGLAVIALILTAALWPRPGPPARYRIDRSTLIVTDVQNRELWRKTFPGLNESTTYRQAGAVWFGDLDGSGTTSVLFLFDSNQTGDDYLVAYSDRGRERWRFTPGGPVRTATKEYAFSYHAAHFLAAKLGRDGHLRIVVSSVHNTSTPCQIALLDTNGRKLREYWHNGHLQLLLASDLGQGWNSLVLAGVSNPRRTSTLVALDPDRFTGASTEDDPAEQFLDFPPPVEMARILFPRSCISSREPFTNVTGLWQERGSIGLEIHHQLNPMDAAVYYHLNRDLTLQSADVGTAFEKLHLRLRAEKTIDHDLSPAEKSALGKLTYLTGGPASH
jgi:hypothetical protein